MLRKSMLALLLIILLLGQTLPAAASDVLSEYAYVATRYAEDEGLPTGEANTVLQDSRGYLWIGSYGGLIRYDGTNFLSFNNEMGASTVRSLFEDSKGRLFIGTNDKGAVMMENDVFTPIEGPADHSYLSVRSFAEGKDGAIYLASGSGVAKIVDGALLPIQLPAEENEQFYSIICDGRGRIWTCTSSGDIHVIENGAFSVKYTSAEFLEHGRCTALATSEDGAILIGSSEGEILRLSLSGSGTTVSARFDCSRLGSINQIKAAAGVDLVSGLNGFGVLEEKSGLHRIDHSADALSANWAELDYENNFWIASSNYGLIRYTGGCFNTYNEQTGLSGVFLNAVHKEGGRFYLATDSGVLLYDEDWNALQTPLVDALAGIRVRNITSDVNGNVWFATYAGAMRYEPKSGKLTAFDEEHGLQSNTTRVVYGLSDGRVLIGNQLGFAIVSGDEIVERYGSEAGMSNSSVLCALELSDGSVLVGSDGSGVYELKDGALIEHGFNEGLREGVVLRLTEDSQRNGSYFVCGGSEVYHYENGAFRLLDNLQKNPGSVYNLYDRDGRIWILQDAGILSADKAGTLAGEIVYTPTYGQECGLSGSLSANTWCYLDEDGTLYLPTRNGVSSFYFKSNDIPIPRGIVNSITVDDDFYPHPVSLELDSGARRVTIDMAALLFTDTREVQLAYQLQGFDEAETIVNDKYAKVSYTNLPGGEYSLSVRVIDPLSGEDSKTLTMRINKAKKLSEYPLFWFLLAAALIAGTAGIVFLGTRYRLKRVQKHAQELQDITEQALHTVARTIDAKDEYTRGHSSRVAVYSREIARRMGFSPEEQQRIYYIGMMHDIGKIGVPDSILNKKGPLTPEERSVIQQHPVRGGEILKDFRALDEIADGARFHHERYDGSGYGEGRGGLDIPLVARIIGVADSYDAMQSSRCYRPGLTTEKITSELEKGAGTQFDPEIVPIMLEMIADGSAPVEEE